MGAATLENNIGCYKIAFLEIKVDLTLMLLNIAGKSIISMELLLNIR